jgi:hypothetical protein
MASRRPSLVFPPLDIAERGIDLDMENLFRTAGAASDPADIDFDAGPPDGAADPGSTIALPQACALLCPSCTVLTERVRRAGFDCLSVTMYVWSLSGLANVYKHTEAVLQFPFVTPPAPGAALHGHGGVEG